MHRPAVLAHRHGAEQRIVDRLLAHRRHDQIVAKGKDFIGNGFEEGGALLVPHPGRTALLMATAPRDHAHARRIGGLIADVLRDATAPCVTSSFQAECVVLVHMLRDLRPDIPVLFLDTFHHFPQTLEYRDEMAKRYKDLNLPEGVSPDQDFVQILDPASDTRIKPSYQSLKKVVITDVTGGTVTLFAAGQLVDVQGTSIGKGFAGTIKRHNFGSQRASHGNSRSHNVPGSISMAQDPGRVFPGKRMTGHLGDVTVTTQNLEIARIDAERQLLLVKGAVPGAKNGQVIVKPAVKVKAKKGA